MILLTLIVPPEMSEAAVKISKKKATMEVDSVLTLKISGTDSKVAWKTSNKKIATVKKGKVTAKAEGTATITATVDSKKYTCNVTVVDSNKEEVCLINVDLTEFDSDKFVFYTNSNRCVSKIKFTSVDCKYEYSKLSNLYSITFDYIAQSLYEPQSMTSDSNVTYWFDYKLYDKDGCVIASDDFYLPLMKIGEKVKGSFIIHSLKLESDSDFLITLTPKRAY